MRRLPPVHPGAVLSEEFLAPLHLDAHRVAKDLRVPDHDLRLLLNQAGPVTAALSLRLARYFGTTPEFWLYLQVAYDLATTQDEQGERICEEVSPNAADR